MLKRNGKILSVVRYRGEPVGSGAAGKAEGLEEGYRNGYSAAKEEFEPAGSIEIVANGTVDVSKYAEANVAVPMPEKTYEQGLAEGKTTGYNEAKEEFEPAGSIEIVANGTHDVSGYAEAVVNVPMPEKTYEDGWNEALASIPDGNEVEY